MTIKLKVDTREEWLNLYWEFQKMGLLESVTVNDIALPESAFPVEIPVDISGLTKLMTNPLVKMQKKRIAEAFSGKVKNVKAYIV